MNDLTDYNKYKKYFKAAGAACLLIAAVGIGLAVIFAIDFFELVNASTVDKRSIMFFIAGALRFWAGLVYVAGIIVFIALSVKFTLSGIALITLTNERRTKSAVRFSFVGSLIVFLASVYPFIINVCRIAVHGYLEEYYFGFWFGMVSFVFSTLCLVFNRLAVREYKSLKIKKSLLLGESE